MHPALAPMIERNAFVGRLRRRGRDESGGADRSRSHGHHSPRLVLMFGDTVEALKAFNDVIDPKVRRVALIDTLQDEKFEAIRVAEALGKDLYAVRLDTRRPAGATSSVSSKRSGGSWTSAASST